MILKSIVINKVESKYKIKIHRSKIKKLIYHLIEQQ